MAKFINKKEQVLDFELTPYGKYTLSNGTFKPTYYAFYDGEILYDGAYANRGGSGIVEIQNNIHKRIKEDTVYLESLVAFDELETSPPNESKLVRESKDDLLSREVTPYIADGTDKYTGAEFDTLHRFLEEVLPTDLNYFPTDVEVRQEIPRKDIYRFGQPIGDAKFDGPTQQSAPAWKVVVLQGHISSSHRINLVQDEERIPQLHVNLTYKKRITTPEPDDGSIIDPAGVMDVISSTQTFADGNIIKLVADDLIIYTEETNTELLTENFDIDVFEIEEVPAQLAQAQIIIADKARAAKCPTAGETISINDGVTSVTFEFIEPDGAASGDNIGVITRAVDYCDDATVSLTKQINASSLNVTATSNAGDSRTLLRYLSLINHNETRPFRTTNYPLSETMTNGSVSGFSSGSAKKETLHRKYFARTNPQVIDGIMQYATAPDVHMFGNVDPLTLTTSSVEYYFDVFTDTEVDQKAACRGSQLFNKDSYYIDLDFNCDPEESCKDDDALFYDIYGRIVEDPEICDTEGIGD